MPAPHRYDQPMLHLVKRRQAMKTMKRIGGGLVSAACLGLFAAGEAAAATVDVFLRADVFTIPAGTYNAAAPIVPPADITMWGFDVTDSGYTAPAPGTPWAPVVVTAAEGDTLNVNVQNDLTGLYTEPVSVVIPGQTPVLADGTWPTWTDGTTGPRVDPTQRVRSFTFETATGTSQTYTFSNLKAGTYLIESGTHPAVQDQMGLYGVLKVLPATAGQAYDDPSSAFGAEATLLLSEIDPVLHSAVALGDYGPTGTMTSTSDYHPKYFLVNGQPYTASAANLPSGSPGVKLLLRILNAGLETKVPTVFGPYMALIAEDGNFMSATLTTGTKVPAPKQQYEVVLPAGKTMDAILTPTAVGTIPVFDRRLNLTNNGLSPGGMLAFLGVTSAVSPTTLVLSSARGCATTSSCGTGVVTLTNTGAVNWSVTGDTITGGTTAFRSMYSVSATSLPLPANLAPGASMTFTVTFAPPASTTVGNKWNASGPNLNITISGQPTQSVALHGTAS
jgi:FtsP/CotA-like multicopper oxidase with cupredoxin domain